MTHREFLICNFCDLLQLFADGRLSDSEMAEQARSFADTLSAPADTTFSTCLPSHFHLQATPAALRYLLNELQERGYIHRRTDFAVWSWVCCGRLLTTSFAPVMWLGSVRSLSWFVSQFFDRIDTQLWKTASVCFVLSNGHHPKAGTLRRSVNKVLRSPGLPYVVELDGILSAFRSFCASPTESTAAHIGAGLPVPALPVISNQ